MVFSALLDTSVLFPMTLRDTLLRVASEDLYRPLWSQHILEELRARLISRYALDPPDADRIIRLMTQHFPDSLVEGYERLIEETWAPDPDDRHVLAAAITAKVEVIVTANIGDFPQDCEERHGISVQSPDDFLLERFTEDPRAVRKALDQQVAGYRKPPKTVEELLDRLALADFSEAVRRYSP